MLSSPPDPSRSHSTDISKHHDDQSTIAEHSAPQLYSIAVAWVWLPAGLWLIADQTLGLRSDIPLQSAHLLPEPRCEALLLLPVQSTVLFNSLQALHFRDFLRVAATPGSRNLSPC